MAMRAVDLDLFVNSASKGFNDGAKVPSPFAAFTDSFIKGIDAQQDYETQALDNQRKQIEIEQAPIQAKIREAELVKKEAEAKVITDNKDLYEQSQIAGLKAEAAEKERKARLQSQQTRLAEIQQSDDPVAKSNAANSQEFADLFAADPKIKEQYVKTTYSDWDENGQKLYDGVQAAERQKAWNLEMQETVFKQDTANQEALISDSGIQTIKQAVEDQIGEKINEVDLLEKGRIVTRNAPAPIPNMVENADKKLVPETDEFGNIIMVPNKAPGIDDKYTEQRFFEYTKQDGKKAQLLLPSGIGSETNKVYNNAKTTWAIKQKLNAGQDGVTDLQQNSRKTKEVKAAANAQSAMNYEKNAAEIKSQSDAFFAGTKIAPKYQEAATRVQAQSQEKPSADVQGLMGTPTAGSVPDLTPGSAEKSVVNPNSMDWVNSATRDAKGNTIIAPEFTVTPGTAAKSRATTVPTTQQQPALSQEDKTADLKQQMAKRKAAEITGKYQKNNAPVPPSPTPIDQARQVTSSSFVPSKMTVKINSSYGPDPEAVARVSSNPMLQGFSAITKAMITHESRGVSNAVSKTGVEGLAQLTEATAEEISPDIDRDDPLESAMGGAIYLERLMAEPTFENNPMLALTAYNGGEGVVAEAIKMAGSTDWDVVKNFLSPATMKFRSTWIKKGIDPAQKAREVRAYAERVVANFPSYISTRGDMNIAEKLKQQKVLSF